MHGDEIDLRHLAVPVGVVDQALHRVKRRLGAVRCIGQSAPLTGANAELGNDIRNGALAYFRKVNESGGVHGRSIELVTLDDGNQVPRAEINTKKLTAPSSS